MASSSVSFNKIPTLIDDGNTFVYALREDKPDVKHYPMIPAYEVEDTRPRVEQKPQKGPTCFFHAMDFLRVRIGPNPSPEYEKARTTEVMISGFQKELTRSALHINPGIKIYFQCIHKFFLNKNFTRATLLSRRTFIEEELQRSTNSSSSESQSLLLLNKTKDLFQRFLAQEEHDDFFTFIDAEGRTEMDQICLIFLNNLTDDPKHVYETNVATDISEGLTLITGTKTSPSDPKVEEMVRNLRPSLVPNLFNMTQTESARAFGFQFAPWTPENSIGDLQKTLKTYGPLIVGGCFGSGYYSVDPKERENIAGRPIFGWLATQRHPFDDPIGHTVILVGTKTQSSHGEFVYFVDPACGPGKIHIISYKNLTTHVCHLHCNYTYETLRENSSTLFGYEKLHRYAYYHPQHMLTGLSMGTDQEVVVQVDPLERIRALRNYANEVLLQINPEHPPHSDPLHQPKAIGCQVCADGIRTLESTGTFVFKNVEGQMRVLFDALPDPIKSRMCFRAWKKRGDADTAGDPKWGEKTFFWNLHKVISICDDEWLECNMKSLASPSINKIT